MYVLSQILAGLLASDPLWFVLVVPAVLAVMAAFRGAAEYLGKRRRRRLPRAVR